MYNRPPVSPMLAKTENTTFYIQIKIDNEWIDGVMGDYDFVKQYYDEQKQACRIIKRIEKTYAKEEITDSKRST